MRDPQPRVTRLKRVHPFVDRPTRTFHPARNDAPIVRPRLVVDPGFSKEGLHVLGITRGPGGSPFASELLSSHLAQIDNLGQSTISNSCEARYPGCKTLQRSR
jgi:hypothetical protein